MSEMPDQLVLEDGCPKCHSANVVPVKYTWWGGVVGPRLLHHTKCKDCGYVYNRKSRKSNTTNIILYSVIIIAVVFVLYYFINRN